MHAMRKAAAIFAAIILLSVICFPVAGCRGNSDVPERADSISSDDSINAEEASEDSVAEMSMPLAADMIFEDFIFNFASNRKLQANRISFPLPITRNGEKTLIDKRQWQTEHFFMDKDYYTLIFDNRRQMRAMNDTAMKHVTLENILLAEKTIKQYIFNRIDGKWMLTEIVHLPLEKSQNASFLSFYERFATDESFQIESMSRYVNFSIPDPNHDFTSMTGTLQPDQWPAFKPEFMPADSLLNIVYGNDTESGPQRIFIIEGVGSGMRTEMTFRQESGRWRLKELNS